MRLKKDKAKPDAPSEPLSEATVRAIEAQREVDEAERQASREAAPVEQVTPEEADSALSRAYAAYANEDSESFLEILVRPKRKSIDYLKIVGIFLAYLVLLYLGLAFIQFISFLLPLIVVGGGWGVWWLLTSLNREYEYIVTKGDLDIDTVIAQRRRKRSFSVRAKDIELMAACTSDDYKQVQRQTIQTRDYSVDPGNEKNWFILSQYKGVRQLTLITPEERVVRAMHRYSPSRVRYNRMVGL